MKKLLSALILSVLALASAQAQTAAPADTIRGIVVDAKGKPVKKANVAIGDVKATTDKDGFFQLNGVDLKATATVTVKKNSAQVAMRGVMYPRIQVDGTVASVQPDNDAIMKLVLKQAKKNRRTTGNAIVTGEELVETGYDNLLEAMAGKVAGLIVQTDDNGNVVVKIRGTNSSGNGRPLYIVDGMQVDRLDTYNVRDVKQVEVLKESNIYGARGGSGVIVVTLK